jgi:hypothetical protein
MKLRVKYRSESIIIGSRQKAVIFLFLFIVCCSLIPSYVQTDLAYKRIESQLSELSDLPSRMRSKAQQNSHSHRPEPHQDHHLPEPYDNLRRDATTIASAKMMNMNKYLFRRTRNQVTVAPASFSGVAWDPSQLASLKGVFCGSGSDMMNDSRPIEAIVKLVGKPVKDIRVLYLGTASYDIEMFQTRQTKRFVDLGCKVSALQVAENHPSNDMDTIIDKADVIVVGGGNTLYAIDRWQNLKMIPQLRRAMERGAVLTGGSAGAICWFDGGHSGTYA